MKQEPIIEHAFQLLITDFSNSNTLMNLDSVIKSLFEKYIFQFSNELELSIEIGRISKLEATSQIYDIRTATMDFIHSTGSGIGRIIKQYLQQTGNSFNDIIGKKTIELFGPTANYFSLSPDQKNTVFEDIVFSCSLQSYKYQAIRTRVSQSGKKLVQLAAGISVYMIATSLKSIQPIGSNTDYLGVLSAIGSKANGGISTAMGVPNCVSMADFVCGSVMRDKQESFW
ncbi:MAG TPA: hypothetical protein PL185_09335 [Flavobacteriales bacterium]|nr:hypothetical protein [Flavobacteriales bacterium]